MAGAVLERKSARLDLRMTEDDKAQIETAAHIDGVSVSQWSIAHLVENARRTISEQAVIKLSAEAFDEFARLLDEPRDPAFDRFAKGTTRWEV